MIFIETHLVTKLITQYLQDDEYHKLQAFLLDNPGAGVLIKGAGGLRKIRWTSGNKGKKGGVRIIYYWQAADECIYFMTIYAKNEVSDLTVQEKKRLKDLIKAEWEK